MFFVILGVLCATLFSFSAFSAHPRTNEKGRENCSRPFLIFIARVFSEQSDYDRAKECKDKTSGQKMQLPNHGTLPIPRRREFGNLEAEFQATKLCCAAG